MPASKCSNIRSETIISEHETTRPKGGNKQIKKFVAIILTLTLVAALLVTPALALDAACPECGTVHSHYAVEEAVYNNVTVSSCDYASYSHTHVYYRLKYSFYCSCGRYSVWYGSSRIFCGASNMNMRAINMIN